MSDKPRPGGRRPVVGSRTATSRPRRIAGAAAADQDHEAQPVEGEIAEPEIADSEIAEPEIVEPRSTTTGPGWLSRRSTTTLLAAVMAALLALIAATSWYLWLGADPEPTADRPVVISEVERAGAVAAAQQHVVTILTRSHESYDEQTEAALELIVPDSEFAEEFAQTAQDVKDAFVEDEVELEYTVVGASVVRAGPEKVQALLFLNQFTTKGGAEPTFTPYRALVTVVPSGTGWRVLTIDTK
ncbi:hypothetical protein [Nocardioides sp.]|uniref:hypothetical protein n=1 Tax=Nocardioides sp. TaxID=35761 RepID=UPI002732BABA|nr:hypothetical protein [Nocardioides sp.]MDP3890313.1 hypothetical protein [Nocardioides sp.]